MPPKPPSSIAVAKPRRRVAAGTRHPAAEVELGPMMSELRRRAESQMRTQRKARVIGGEAEDTDARRALHELQVHQIELEVQNEELRKTRDEMEAGLGKYTDLYDFAPVGYFSLDEASRIMEVNLTGSLLLGVERSRLLHRCLDNFIAAPRRADFMAFLKQAFCGIGKLAYEMSLVLEDGAVLSADIQAVAALSPEAGRRLCRVSIADITATRQAEVKMRESQEEFHTLAEAMSQLAWIARPDGFIKWYNQRWYEYTGTTPEQMEGWGWQRVHDPELLPKVLKRWKASLATGQTFDMNFPLRGADGTFRLFLTRSVPLKDKHGRVLRWFGTNTDIEDQHRAAETRHKLDVLAASNQKLEREVIRRRVGETSLRESVREHRRLLTAARRMQKQMRLLSHQIIHAQEEERKRISRELHDEIAQTLTGISVQLATLKAGTSIHAEGLQKRIIGTQRLVEKSVEIVHRFARELRPSVLDDLGLIPALHAYVDTFAMEKELPVSIRVCAEVEQLDAAKRTVLYRVAQEALTNVARHARATKAGLRIEKLADAVRLRINDNGRGFSVQRTLLATKNGRLGLLGMRERVEMVGGRFAVESAPRHGTTIEVQIPVGNAHRGGRARRSVSAAVGLAKSGAHGVTRPATSGGGANGTTRRATSA